MRGDAELGDLVHFAGADLDFDALPLRAEHAGMEAAIAVGLGRRDVILEAARHDRIVAVDDAERLIALLDACRRRAKGHDVGKLLEADILALHLAPDRIRRFFAPRHLRLDAGLRSASRCSSSSDAADQSPPFSRRKLSRATMLSRASGYSSAKARSSSSSCIFVRCRCARPAARRFPSSRARCGGAFPGP